MEVDRPRTGAGLLNSIKKDVYLWLYVFVPTRLVPTARLHDGNRRKKKEEKNLSIFVQNMCLHIHDTHKLLLTFFILCTRYVPDPRWSLVSPHLTATPFVQLGPVCDVIRAPHRGGLPVPVETGALKSFACQQAQRPRCSSRLRTRTAPPTALDRSRERTLPRRQAQGNRRAPATFRACPLHAAA